MAAALPVLLPFLKAEFHLTFAQAGLLSNFAFVGGFATIAAAGWAVDVFGDRVVLVLGGITAGLAAFLCAIVPALWLILVALLVMGAGMMMPTPAGSIAVRSAFAVQLRGMVMSIRQTGIPLGGFLAALILPTVAINAGWRAALVTAGAISIGISLIGLAAYRSGAPPAHDEHLKGNVFRVLTRDMRVAATSGLFLVSSQICLLTYLVIYLIHDRHLALTVAAFFLGLAQLAAAAGRVLWGVVSDRIMHGRRRPAVLLATSVGALGALALALAPIGAPLVFIVVAILVAAIGAVGWNGVQISFISELARPGTEGRSVGLGLMIQQPGILLGPFLFGWVVDATNSFQLAWLLVAGFLVAAILIMSAAHERPHPASSPPASGVAV